MERYCAAQVLDQPDTLEEVCILGADHGAASHVLVSAQVLGGRMDQQVCAQLEGPLQHGAGPGVVAGAQRSGGMGDVGHPGDVGDLEQRIGRCFDPDQTGVGLHGSHNRILVGHVHEAGLQTPGSENLPQHLRCAVVAVIRRDDMITRGQGLEHRRGGRRSGPESRGLRVAGSAALQQREALLQGAAVGVVHPGVDEPARVFAVGVALEGGREVNGRRDGSGRLVDLVGRLGGDGFELHDAATPGGVT